MRSWLDLNRQKILNLFLFFFLGRFAFIQRWEKWKEGRFDLLEATFVAQNLVALSAILVREEHKAVDSRIWPQCVALAAFFSGAGFIQTEDAPPILIRAARWVTFFALLIGILAFISLGRSFGILVAGRRVQTGGLYRFIRHPMYLSDLIWRIGYLLNNACKQNIVLFFFSSGCYMYRAVLEERFLREDPAYEAYCKQVNYRFIPGIW